MSRHVLRPFLHLDNNLRPTDVNYTPVQIRLTIMPLTLHNTCTSFAYFSLCGSFLFCTNRCGFQFSTLSFLFFPGDEITT